LAGLGPDADHNQHEDAEPIATSSAGMPKSSDWITEEDRQRQEDHRKLVITGADAGGHHRNQTGVGERPRLPMLRRRNRQQPGQSKERAEHLRAEQNDRRSPSPGCCTIWRMAPDVGTVRRRCRSPVISMEIAPTAAPASVKRHHHRSRPTTMIAMAITGMTAISTDADGQPPPRSRRKLSASHARRHTIARQG